MDCGIIVGNLFNPIGRSQLSLEQITINDKVNAFEYSNGTCNDEPAFRNYTTYRFTLSDYAGDPAVGNCGIDGTEPPADPNDPFPCTGDIDIRFSSMLASTETSSYRKDWIDMLTDEVSKATHPQSLEAALSICILEQS